MTYKKLLGYTTIIFCILALVLVSLNIRKNDSEPIAQEIVKDIENTTSSTTISDISDNTDKDVPKTKTEIKQEQATISVSVIIAGTKYDVALPKNNSAYDAMRALASSSKITYHSQYYSGLGNFIDEINGIKSNSQNYWIWYLNNMKASLGISSYIVKTGDIMEWKYEKAE